MRNQKFDALLDQMAGLHDRKNTDYASDANPYSNFEEAAREAEGFTGVDAVFAVLIGIKKARLRELLRSGKTPNNESIVDTRTDLAMYATLWASYHMPAPSPASGRNRVGDHGQRVCREGDAERRSDQPCRHAERSEEQQLAEIGAHEREPITYDERRSNVKPCKCGALFTHPEQCDASEKCLAAQHPHFIGASRRTP